ncbi:MAG: ABC transporter permease, partial [Acidimicrobiia bacterium]
MLIPLLKAQLRMMLRDRGTLGVAFILPIGMALFFGLILQVTTKPVELGLVIGKPSPASDAFAGALVEAKDQRGGRQFVVKPLRQSEIRRALEQGRIDVALVVPDVTEGSTVTLVYDETEAEELPRVAGPISVFVQRYNLQLVGASETLKLELKGLRAKEDLRGYNALLPAIIMFGVLFTNFGSLSQRLVRQREEGVMKRLNLTPLRPRTYL